MRGTPATARLAAWLGGAAFVVSLLFFLWSYFVRFGRVTAAGALAPPLAVDVVLFSIFALHHSVFARSGAKRWLSTYVPAHLERTLYVWLSSAMFVALCALWRPVPGLLYQSTGLWSAPHWIAVAAGVWLTLRSAGVIDPLELAGIRQASGEPTTPRFRVVGPYRLVRHPIYLGWLLLVFGVPVMTGTRLTFAVVSSAYLVLAIRFEERSLIEAFGDEYRRYRERVRWRLVPGVW